MSKYSGKIHLKDTREIDITEFKRLDRFVGRIGIRLELLDFCEIGQTTTSGYAIDEKGYVVGLNVHEMDLNYIPSDLIAFQNLRKLGFYRNKICDISILINFPQLTELNLTFNPIQDISILKDLTNLTHLDLGSNQIHDISVLEELSQLKSLSIGSNPISDFSVIGNLNNLNSLRLYDLFIGDNSIFGNLSNLKKLILNRNQINDISPLSSLSQLEVLNLAHNEISDIAFLKGLLQLNELNLIYNGIVDVSPLKNLFQLKELNLSYNKIVDISPLENLSRLEELSLSHNKVVNIFPLEDLPHLEKLDLSYNKIVNISPLGNLSQLVNLNLSYNQIRDISLFENLRLIKKLDLSNNRIHFIANLKKMKNLTYLNLSSNKIIKIPEELFNLEMKLKWQSDETENGLFFGENPIKMPPIEIVKQGKKGIEAYFKSLKKGENLPLNEVKAILVGDGGSGKTSLVNRMLKYNFNPNEPQTHGIKINHWDVTRKNAKIRIHLWDFGGQDIMHATHQFFLSKRSLYILVLDGRRDEKTEYWLKHIQSFGGDSPVLVVLNKIDENPGFEVNRRFLQEKYKNIKGFYRISCATNKGINEFMKELVEVLNFVEILQTTWPDGWFRVKTFLENMEANFLSYDEYKKLCFEEDVKDEFSQKTLVDFLKDLGVILHFKDLQLEDTHILEPRWVTEAVYRIINSEELASAKGVLRVEQLDEILKKRKKSKFFYPRDKYRYIIELMKKFELCYKIDDNKMLVPDLLDVRESRYNFDFTSSLKFFFQYDFLPRSVMPRFIVRMHSDIKNDCRWRTGVVLENSGFKATSVVKADYEEKKIFIYVNGSQKRDYFAVIRHTIWEINKSFEKLKVTEMVPLPDQNDIAVNYEELIGYEEIGEKFYLVGKLKKRYSIKQLLAGIEKEEVRRIGEGKRFGTIEAGGNINIYNLEGDHSSLEVHNIIEVERKLEIIIQQLEEHKVPGRAEFIKQLQDDEVKKDKKKLRGVLGKILTRAAEVGTIASAIASLL